MKRSLLAILLLALAGPACVGPEAQAPAPSAAAGRRSAPDAQPNPYIITPPERRLLRALKD